MLYVQEILLMIKTIFCVKKKFLGQFEFQKESMTVLKNLFRGISAEGKPEPAAQKRK